MTHRTLPGSAPGGETRERAGRRVHEGARGRVVGGSRGPGAALGAYRRLKREAAEARTISVRSGGAQPEARVCLTGVTYYHPTRRAPSLATISPTLDPAPATAVVAPNGAGPTNRRFDNPNLLLRDFLQERWRGLTPVLWGQQLKQERLDELIYLSIMNVDHLPPDDDASPLTEFWQFDTTPGATATTEGDEL